MYIVMVAPECAPAAKSGGLGDVVFGLSRELEIRGNAVEISSPNTRACGISDIWGCSLLPRFVGAWYGRSVHCHLFFAGCTAASASLSTRTPRRTSSAGTCCTDMAMMRCVFAFFSKAALEFLLRPASVPMSSHCHDCRPAWSRCCCMQLPAGDAVPAGLLHHP